MMNGESCHDRVTVCSISADNSVPTLFLRFGAIGMLNILELRNFLKIPDFGHAVWMEANIFSPESSCLLFLNYAFT